MDGYYTVPQQSSLHETQHIFDSISRHDPDKGITCLLEQFMLQLHKSSHHVMNSSIVLEYTLVVRIMVWHTPNRNRHKDTMDLPQEGGC